MLEAVTGGLWLSTALVVFGFVFGFVTWMIAEALDDGALRVAFVVAAMAIALTSVLVVAITGLDRSDMTAPGPGLEVMK